MNANVIDVLLYLFENYLYEDAALGGDLPALERELEGNGFGRKEIRAALDWLQALEQRCARTPVAASGSLRVYAANEVARLDRRCRGFIHALEQSGVLDVHSRELVLDRVMALPGDEVDIEQLQWVILLVLFHRPGQEAAFEWMRDFLYDIPGSVLH